MTSCTNTTKNTTLYIHPSVKKKTLCAWFSWQQKGKDYCSIQRVLEGSESISNWKGLIRIIKSPTPISLEDWIKWNHMTKSNIYMFFELHQVWCCDHFPGEPVLVPNHPLSKESFPNVQLELPWHTFIPFLCVLSQCLTRSLVFVLVRILTVWYFHWKKGRQRVVLWLETLKKEP